MPSAFEDIFSSTEAGFIAEQSQTVTLPPDTTVFHQGDACQQYFFVLSGSIKVINRAENGREVVLYRVRDNQSCTLTTACLFTSNPYPAEGITEVETTALAIPREVFNQGLAQSERFRRMVFDQYARRLTDVINLVEELSFGRIDIRLARFLAQRAHHSPSIDMTHQAIATELGSAREVISRQLKSLEKQRLISLQRGSIHVEDLEGLQRLAESRLI